MFEKPTTFRTFPGVLRGWIYLFYSIQYARVVILRNTQTHKQRLFEHSPEYYVDVYICSTVYSTPEWSYSVTNKHTHTNTHTHTQTHKANLKESRILGVVILYYTPSCTVFLQAIAVCTVANFRQAPRSMHPMQILYSLLL